MPVSPLDTATDVLDRARVILNIESAETNSTSHDDLCRMALAMGVAAIDTYMHTVVRKIDLNGPIPKQLMNLEISFSTLIESSRQSLEARKDGVNDRPMVRARNALNEKLSRLTFQSARGVETALAMAGQTGYWRDIANALNSTPKEVKDKLNALAYQRNLIVHEGDIKRRTRPQKISHNDVSKTEVGNDIEWIHEFLKAVTKTINFNLLKSQLDELL